MEDTWGAHLPPAREKSIQIPAQNRVKWAAHDAFFSPLGDATPKKIVQKIIGVMERGKVFCHCTQRGVKCLISSKRAVAAS